MLEWTNGHNSGISQIDDLNKSFHQKLNEFLAANVEGKGKEHVEHLLDFLKKYTDDHLNLQGRFMSTHGYPNRDEHENEHQSFIAELKRMNSILETEGITSTMVLELQNSMGEWFVHHIGIQDKNLGNYLKKQSLA